MNIRLLLALAAAALLGWSFWRNDGWLHLCAGLAVFLFGMQLLEEGLRQLAGGKLEQLLARSTSTPAKGLLFGIGGTTLLQSSTLVSLLTIAFISSGLIQLAGGIAIIFGANLGATSGIWLLALAGQNLSLSPLALPLLVFGVLAGFTGATGKAAGRVVLGVAFIFLGIDQIKGGFEAFGGGLDMAAVQGGGVAGVLLFTLGGLVATVILQSSHATLMLTLAALAGGQLQLEQSLAIAIGSNVGSSVSTAFVGMLGGNRSGQRLALAHVLFNAVTALSALVLLVPLTWVVKALAGLVGFGGNPLLQLALFHTLFNAGGVALFWPWQATLARWLTRWLPDRREPAVATAIAADTPAGGERLRARHLSEQALESADAAAAAVALELRHLGESSLDVICQALGLPPGRLQSGACDDPQLDAAPAGPDAEALYQRQVKGVYGDLLAFMGRLELPLDEEHQRFWAGSQMAALQLVDAVKSAKHLQKNLGPRLREPDSPQRTAYVDLRRHLFRQVCALRAIGASLPDGDARQERLEVLDRQAEGFAAGFRQRLFAQVRQGLLDGLQAGSLLNDQGYAERIYRSLREAMAFADEPGSLRQLRRLAQPAAPAMAASAADRVHAED
ncbi:Na/Pi symporter [Flavobacterium sp. MXW15]|uniref:Na/Pi symporter n=1 Tax=Xanthomonas chitinilytica TaxID=2989819 RepID=A0ABT3JXC0_9XANT|nr:Na/Pi symporter [Xanthomonas sp. H13-6]MCW4455317.1 Na/Pi symporter [Flavobacterium sp. MXW15]MCW4473144.1 Na/Pi symporter [Xanthomonas sp. H13-6]